MNAEHPIGQPSQASAGNARWRRWYQRNKEEYSRRRKAERAENKETMRGRELKRRYDLTLDQYDDMVRSQEGRCAICAKKPRSRLHVDHCHDTGAVRALLCGSCNRMIGLAHHDPETLRAAVSYLRQHNGLPF